MKTWEEFRTSTGLSIDENGIESPYIYIQEPTWRHVRNYRNYRLELCDINVLRYLEVGLPVPPEWVAYRQALRDITTTFAEPTDVVFPAPPEVVIPPVVTSQEDRLEAAELMIDLILDTQQEAA